jgi:hypothetical protein
MLRDAKNGGWGGAGAEERATVLISCGGRRSYVTSCVSPHMKVLAGTSDCFPGPRRKLV